MCFLIISVFFGIVSGKAIELLDAGSMGPVIPNYCNDSSLMEEAGLIRASLGQFLGYGCSSEFYHCRWQSDGFLTYKKHCKTGLVYDVLGTQNCNYNYNVKSCGISGGGPSSCNSTSFHCSLSEQCLPLSQRCDGRYDCALEEDEQNCPLCAADEFACIVSEQCIEADRRCNGIVECSDGTDEMNCEVCGNGLFHCAKSGECVLMEERCDGKRQCPHAEDEMLCKKSSSQYRTYTCQSMKQKIPMVQVCDGIPHCDDGSDEMYCETSHGGRYTAESSIAFSSNPNPAVQEEPTDYATDYEEETPAKEDEPSFPMLTVALSSPPPVSATFPSLIEPPNRVQPQTKISPSAPPTFSKRTKVNTEATTRSTTLLTTRLTTTTTTTARPTTRLTTEATSSSKAAVKQGTAKTNRYPTKPSSQAKERNLFVVDKSVSPRNEVPKQLFAQPDDSESKAGNVATLPAVIHEVKMTSVSARPTTLDTDPRSRLLNKLGTQLNGRVSPELLSKLEKLLTEEVQASPRKETTPGTVVESSALVSHIAPVSSTSLVRAFTSRVHKDE